MFHEKFGYYAHGVDDTTATLADGSGCRLVAVQTAQGAVGWCLDLHDLPVSKLIAEREKDSDFVAAMLRAGLASVDVLQERFSETSNLPPERRNLVTAWLGRHG